MIRIGKLALDAPFFEAGLAGYSDAAMRLVARRHGCPYCVTEAMLDQFLIHGGKGLAAAELDARDHPIAGQLMGSHPADIARGAAILVKLGYDVIDVNLACPVKKIRRKCRGGHLLSQPDEAVAILDAVRQAVGEQCPCTVKLRRGTDDSAQAEADFHRIFAKVIELGYAAAVVHGRTVEQKYHGPSRWPFLADLVRQYGPTSSTSPPGRGRPRAAGPGEGGRESTSPSSAQEPSTDTLTRQAELADLSRGQRWGGFVIGGSGDIFEAGDIFSMIEQTGVGMVSVARGCIGNPWIFRQARALMTGDVEAARRPPTIAQQRDVLLEHFQYSVDLHGEKKASMMMRKFGIKFSRHHHDSQRVANAFIAVKSLCDWRAVLAHFYDDANAPCEAAPPPASDTEQTCEVAAID